MRRHSNQYILEQLKEKSCDTSQQIKPHELAEITGVSAQDLEGISCAWADIQVLCGSLPVRLSSFLGGWRRDVLIFVKMHEEAVIKWGYMSGTRFYTMAYMDGVRCIIKSIVKLLNEKGSSYHINGDELHKGGPGDFTIELKSTRKVQGELIIRKRHMIPVKVSKAAKKRIQLDVHRNL
ncbi:hypothetical protein L6164_019879 [Bauhinia variegata]|uniref:Uncharacterized protein n=1 Tax=Bauhinia variegata TaxID=167791 RepID=A0ACB9MTM6_BAUVA|nr:hypothetical protein L6164_019879 [Bauhinia variegata]